MKFHSEFLLTKEFIEKSIIPAVDYNKEKGEADLGTLIGKSFGWSCTGFGKIKPKIEIGERYTLEIEAFPMDKWVEFKNKLYQYITGCDEDDIRPDSYRVIKMLQELESFGKEQSK